MWKFTPLVVVMAKAGSTPPPVVVPPPIAQTIDAFSSDATSITQGQSVHLSWSVSNATAVRLNGVVVASAAVNCAVTPSTSTNYVLEADGAAATVSKTVAVTVALQPPVTPPSGAQGSLVLVGTNTIADCFPKVDLGYEMGSMGFNGVISNGSFAFAPNLGELGSLVKCGGGHGDGGANEVYIFDIARALWSRLSDPSLSVTTKAQSDSLDCWANPATTHGELLDGSPMACHGFNVLTVIPGGTNGKGLMLRIAAPSLGVGPGGTSAPFAHVADLGVTPIAAPTTIWSRFSQNFCTYRTYASTPVPYAHTYDVENNCAWGVYPGGFHGVLTKLDLGTRLYTNYDTAQCSWGFMPQAAAHPVHGLMVYVAGYSAPGADWQSPQSLQLNAVDLKNPAAGMKQLKLQGDAIPVPVANIGISNYLSPWSFDWDTVNDVGYITGGDQDPTHLWMVTPPKSDYLNQPWTVTKIALPGSLPLLGPDPTDPTRMNLDVIYGHWRYCPSIKAFAYLAHTGKDKARFPDDGKLALWYPSGQ